jgi:Flp pilus assembly protein TadG
VRRDQKRWLQRGSSLVEFVILMPLLFMILFATFEVSRLWLTMGVVSEAAREAARVGAVSVWPGCPSACATRNSSAEATAISVLSAANLSTSSTHTVTCSDSSCPTGQGASAPTVTATVSVPFHTPIPLLVPLFGGANGVTVSQTAQMRYEP